MWKCPSEKKKLHSETKPIGYLDLPIRGISKIECCTRSIYGVIRYLHQKFQVSKIQVLNHTSLLLVFLPTF